MQSVQNQLVMLVVQLVHELPLYFSSLVLSQTGYNILSQGEENSLLSDKQVVLRIVLVLIFVARVVLLLLLLLLLFLFMFCLIAGVLGIVWSFCWEASS